MRHSVSKPAVSIRRLVDGEVMRIFWMVWTFCAALWSPTSWAADAAWQDLTALEQSARAFVEHEWQGSKATIEMGRFDPSLRLAACPQPPQPAWAGKHHKGVVSIVLRCNSPTWTVRLQGKVTVSQSIVVTKRAISAGETLSAEDLTLRSDSSTTPNMVVDIQDAVGKVLARSLPEGLALRTEMLKEPFSVKQGQQVQVRVVGAGFSVSAEGKSIGNASEGQVVAVRMQNGRVVQGVVSGMGIVDIQQ